MTVKKMKKKTLHIYAISQVTQCEPESQSIQSTNIIATLHSKARATTLTGYKSQDTYSHFPKRKYIVPKPQTEIKIEKIMNFFFQSNMERLLNLSLVIVKTNLND